MIRIIVVLLSCLVALAGCSGPKRTGGYYQDDGPGHRPPANIQAIPDAVPRIEAHRPANTRPYRVLGRRYVPMSGEKTFRQTGIASWYGRKFHGKQTASGEPYDMYAMTAAHPTLPLPSYARVTHAGSGKSVIVRINDRGPFHRDRIIDLSYVAASKLGLIGPGSGKVIVEAITHDDIRTQAWMRKGDTPQATPIPAAPAEPAPVLITRATDTSPARGQDVAASGTHDSTAGTPLPDALAVLDGSTGSMDHSASHTTSAPTDDAGKASSDALVPGVTTQVAHSGKAAVAPTHAIHRPTQFFLQYGAFGASDNARQLATRLNQEIAGIERRRAQVMQAANLHKVHIGPYTSRAQAVNAALRIESVTGMKASYTELPPSLAAEQSNASL